MKNYIENTIYISGKYLVFVIAVTTSMVFSQNLSGDRDDILYLEDFSGGTWPSGWSYDAYLVNGDTLLDWSGKPNWRVSNDWSSSINLYQPAIVFNWKPRIPEPTNDINTEYELSVYSPSINVGENNMVRVELDIALKYFTNSDHTNGMLIEADGGDGWLEMLQLEIGPENFVEIDYRTESFNVPITDDTLRLRFKAYGTDSYYIDGWVIDNIKVISLPNNPEPMLTEVGFYLFNPPCAGYPGVSVYWDGFQNPVQMTYDENGDPNEPDEYYAYIDLPAGTYDFEFSCLDDNGNIEFTDTQELLENGGDCIGPNDRRVVDVPMLDNPNDGYDMPDIHWGECPDVNQGGDPCEVLNCDNLHLVSALPPLVLDSLANFGYFSWDDVANGIENDYFRYGIYRLDQEYEFYPASNVSMFNDVENGQFLFAYEYPNGYPTDSVSYMWGVQVYELQTWNEVISEEGLNFTGYVSEPQECLSVIYGNGLSGESQTYYGRTWDPNDYSEELDLLASGEPIGDSIWSFDSYGSCEPLFQDEPEDDLTEVGFYLDGAPCAGNPGVLGSWYDFNSPIEMMYDEYDMDFYIYVDLPVGSHEFTFVCVGPNGEVEFTEDLEPNSDCTDGGGNRMINVPMIDNPDDWHDLPDYSWGLCPGEEYVCDILDCNNLQLVSAFPQQAVEYYTSMGWSFEDIRMAIESGEIEYGVSNSYDMGWTSANYLPQMSNTEEGDFAFAWEYPEGYPAGFDTLFYFWEVLVYDTPDDYGTTLYSEVDEWLSSINPYEDADLPENSCLAFDGYETMLRYWEPNEHSDLLDQLSNAIANEDDMVFEQLWNFDFYGSCESIFDDHDGDGNGNYAGYMSFEDMPSMAHPRKGAASTILTLPDGENLIDYIFVVGGIDYIQSYDPVTGETDYDDVGEMTADVFTSLWNGWSSNNSDITGVPSLIFERRYANAEFVTTTDGNHHVYVFGGTFGEDNEYNYVQLAEKYSFGGGSSQDFIPVPYVEDINASSGYEIGLAATHYGGSAVWDNKIYLFGGSNSDGFSDLVWRFDPNNENFTFVTHMPMAMNTSGEIVDGVLYVLGGYNGDAQSGIHAYDLETGEWSFVGDMGIGVSAHSTATNGEIITVTGGYTSDIIEFTGAFHIESGEFHVYDNNMAGRRHSTSEFYNGELVVIGGSQPSGYNDNESYTVLSSVQRGMITDAPEPMLTEVGFYLDDAPCAGNPGVLGSWDDFNNPVEMMYDEYDMDHYVYADLPPGSHEFTFVCVGPDGQVEFTENLDDESDECTNDAGNRVIDVPMLEDPDDWHDLPDYSWGECSGGSGPCEVLNCDNLHFFSVLPQEVIDAYAYQGLDIGMAVSLGQIEYGVTNSYEGAWSSAVYMDELSDPDEGGFVFAWEYPGGYPMSDDTLFYFWEVVEYPNLDDYGYTLHSEMDEWLTYINPYEDANLPENSCLAVQGDYMLRYWEPYEHTDLLDQFNSGNLSNEDIDDIIVELWNFDSFGSCEGFDPGGGPDGPGMDYTLSNYTIEVFNADHYYDEAIAENSMPYLYIDNSPGVVVRAVFENTTSDGEGGAMAGLLSMFVDTNVNGYLDSLDLNVSGGGSIGDDGPNFNQKVIMLIDNGPNDMDDAVGYFAGDFTDMDVLRIQGATVFFASIDPNMEQNNINEVKEVKPMSNEGQRFTGQTALFDSDVPAPGIVFAAMAFEPNGGYRLGITDEQGMFNIGASFQGFDVEINQLHHHLDRNVAVFQDTSDYVFIPASVSENGYDLGVFGTIDVIRLNTLVQGMIFDQNNSPWLGGFMDVRYDIGLVNDNNQSGSINKHYRLYPDNGHYMYWTLNGTEVEHQYGDSFSNHIQEEHVYVFSDQFDEQLDAYLFYHDYSWEGMSDFGTVSGYVYGEIYNAENGEWSMEPLANVPVDIWSVNDYYTTYSGEDGYYSIDLPAGDYTISSSADLPGLVSNGEYYYFSLYAGGSTSFNLYYESQGNELVHIEGQVVSSGGGSLYDAQVWFEGVSDTSFWDDTFTNDDGIYDMELPYGTYNVAAQYNGHYVSWQYDVLLDGHTTVNFILEVVENFTGSVQGLINFNGQMPPEENAYLNIFNDTYDVRFFAGDDGFYSIDLVDGIYTVFVVAPGYADFYQEDAFEVSGNMVTFDFDMFENGFVGAPHIVSLYDVPNDQGRQMRNVWDPGNPGEWDYFTQFSIWRKVNGAPIELWDYIETVPWHGMNTYAAVVPTLGDSSMHEMHESTFIVTAHTDDVNFFVDSEPVSGYSVDNLHPSAPMAMMAVQGGDAITLSWSSSIDSDFSYYSVYRQDVGSSEEATVFTTTDSFYVDQNIAEAGSYEYWVTAVDLSGLESEASNSVSALLSADNGIGLPTEFALKQNYPNPFNPSTQIRYALPEESMVTITIYDLMGRKVRTLVNDVQSAGYRTVMWNATNDMGRAVSAGMYIYTIQAGDFVMNRKMVLMK